MTYHDYLLSCPVIKFNRNWNGKLTESVRFFTTIRQQYPMKYWKSREYRIQLVNKAPFLARMIAMQDQTLGEVKDTWLRIDTGLPPDEARKEFERMYAKRCAQAGITLDQLPVSLMMFERIKPERWTEEVQQGIIQLQQPVKP